MNQNLPKFPTPQAGMQNNRPSDDNDVIDLGALVSTLWRGKWIIALVAGIAVMLGGYFAFKVATPLYRATAVVIFETATPSVVDLDSVLSGFTGDDTAVNSEVEVLKSRGLMQKVVERLNLTRDPEFNTELREPSLIDGVKSAVLTLVSGGAGDGELTPAEEQKRVQEATVDQLLSKISVRNVPNSLVFQITAETESARKSALVADTLVDLYILGQLEVKYEAMKEATTWLTDRVAQLQVELEAAEARAKEFNTSTDLISIEALAATERQLKELRDRIATAQLAKQAANERVAAMAADMTPDAKAELANDPQLTRLLPRVQAGDADAISAFDLRYDQLVTRAQMDATRLASQVEALTNGQTTLEQQVASQSQDLITLQQYTREAEASRLLYEYFLGRLKETSAQQGIQQADSRVLSDAVVPRAASSPRKPLILVMSAMLGVMIGAALVLLREMQQNSFRTARDLEAHTGYVVMGQVPLLPARQRADAVAYLADKPTSAAAEAIRNLRTSLLLSNVDKAPQVIVTTSSLPGEGKTTMSLALAQNFVGLGKKVLIVEGDIRRRIFGQYLDTSQKEGLVAVLSGERKLSDVVLQDDRIKADILIGEETRVNAADLFASERFDKFVADARKIYDVIIIDTAPVLIVPDARVIARVADAILFTVKWDSTTKSQVEEALHMFESVGERVNGIVLNQIDSKGMKRYGLSGQYGAYGAYGSKYYGN